MANLHLTTGDSAPPLTCSRGKERGGMQKAQVLRAAGSEWLLSAVTGPLPGPAYLPATGAGTDRCHHRFLEPPRRRTLCDPR